MPDIPMFSAPTPTQTLTPQNVSPTVQVAPAQFPAAQSFIDPKALAKALQGGQGTGMPDITQLPQLGNGQDTSQMTPQSYPMGGTAQMQNQQAFGAYGNNSAPNFSVTPQSLFKGGY